MSILYSRKQFSLWWHPIAPIQIILEKACPNFSNLWTTFDSDQRSNIANPCSQARRYRYDNIVMYAIDNSTYVILLNLFAVTATYTDEGRTSHCNTAQFSESYFWNEEIFIQVKARVPDNQIFNVSITYFPFISPINSINLFYFHFREYGIQQIYILETPGMKKPVESISGALPKMYYIFPFCFCFGFPETDNLPSLFSGKTLFSFTAWFLSLGYTPANLILQSTPACQFQHLLVSSAVQNCDMSRPTETYPTYVPKNSKLSFCLF